MTKYLEVAKSIQDDCPGRFLKNGTYVDGTNEAIFKIGNGDVTFYQDDEYDIPTAWPADELKLLAELSETPSDDRGWATAFKVAAAPKNEYGFYDKFWAYNFDIGLQIRDGKPEKDWLKIFTRREYDELQSHYSDWLTPFDQNSQKFIWLMGGDENE